MAGQGHRKKPENLTIRILRQIQSDVGELKTDVRQLKIDVAELKTDVAELKTDVAQLKVDVAELKTDVAILKTDIREVKADIRDLKEGQRTHERAIVKLIQEVSSLNGRFDNFLSGTHQQEHADFRARLARLETKVG
jgi:chromosome segregation ATPase